MNKAVISAKEALNDIRSGMSDAALMRKYKLTARGLDSLYRRLLETQLIAPSEVRERMSIYADTLAESDLLCPFCNSLRLTDDTICAECGYRLPLRPSLEKEKKWKIRGSAEEAPPHKPRIRAKDAVAEIEAGRTDSELMERYNLSPKGLQSLLKKLVKGNFIEAAELDDRLPGYAAAVELSVVSFPSQDVVGSLDTEIDHLAKLTAPEGADTAAGDTAVDGEAETLVDDRIQNRNLWHPDYVDSETAPGSRARRFADGSDETHSAPVEASKKGAVGESRQPAGTAGAMESPSAGPRGSSSRRSAWIIGLVTLAVIVVGVYLVPRLFGPVVPVSLTERGAADSPERGSAFGVPQSPHMLWSFQTGGPVRTTPCVDEGLAFFGSDDGNVYAVDVRSGLRKWSFKTDGLVRGGGVVDDETLYIGSTDNRLYALRTGNGKPRWWFEAFGSITARPCVSADFVYFGSDDGGLYAVQRDSGREAWRFQTDGPVSSAPLMTDSTIVFGSQDRTLYFVSSETGELHRRYAAGAAVNVTPASAGKTIICPLSDGTVHAVSTDDGQRLWKFDAQSALLTSAAVTGELAIVGTGDGALYALNIKDGRPEWRVETSGPIIARPALVKDRVYFGGGDGLIYSVDRATGEITSKNPSGGYISSPTAIDGLLLFGSQDEHLYAFIRSKL